MAGAFRSISTTFGATTANSSTISPDEITTVILTSTDTTKPAPSLITPWLGSTQDLVIYGSVICGFFGFLLILGIIGWIFEQAGGFGDPMGWNIRNVYRKIAARQTVSPFGTFPHVQIANDSDLPLWMRGRPQGQENGGYEHMDQSVRAHHEAAGELDQIRSEMPGEFSDDEDYDDITHDQSPPRPVKPSDVAAYERKSRKKKKKNHQHQQQNTYDTHIPDSSNGHQRANSSQSHPVHYRGPESKVYQTVLPKNTEEQYGGSLYSNSEIPPAVPARD